MKNLAIIPARSGSKGLKDKNIKLLNGKPLIAYTIEAAIESNIFQEVMVSTDSKEYGNIAKKWGARVPFLRNEKLSDDIASSWDVVNDVIEKYKNLGLEFDTITLLQPTSPLRTSKDIIEGYKLFNEKSADSVIGVCEVEHSPIWQNTLPQDNSMYNFIKPEYIGVCRQKLPKYYRVNGALYIVKINKIRELYGKNSYALLMEREKSIDIDIEVDFIIAEKLLSKIKK